MKDLLMRHASTNILRLALLVMTGLALTISTLLTVAIYDGWNAEFPNETFARFPLLAVIWISVPAFLGVMFFTARLLNNIDKNKVYSKRSVKALQGIQRCALVISFVHTLNLPISYIVAQHDDAPGIVIIGMLFASGPFAVAVFAALMQRLLKNAIELKSENDLTV